MPQRQTAEALNTFPTRISDILKPWVELSPDHPAVVEGTDVWTYRQLSLAVNETSSWLLSLGIRPGDRVMIVCENSRGCVAILLALAAMDAWPVLVNARLSAPEIDGICQHSGARRVIYTTNVSVHARQHAQRHGALIGGVGGLGLIGIGLLNEKAGPEPVDSDTANNVAAMIYTSGTTGVPKGVMLTHKNLLFVATVSAKLRSLSPKDRVYGVLPMSHAVGLSVVLLGTLLSGATLYLSARFDPVATLSALERDQLTVLLGVPSMFALLVDYAKSKGMAALKVPFLRIVSSSGAPLQPQLKEAVQSLFGLVLHNGYGVTELSPNIAQTSVEAPRTDTSVGRVIPGVEAKIVNDDGTAVAEGKVGELRVRGPNVMKGYYKNREETAAAIDQEGWFNTRDLAKLENDHLFIVGRTKELIIRFGFNIYPAEVELVLSRHPAVVRCAVMGRSLGDEEEVIAFVQLAEGSQVTVAELAKHAAQNLTKYKQPSEFYIVREMPTTASGKVKKAELARMFGILPPLQRS